MILSASRRTDIPALYGEWFKHKIHQGFLYVKNPYNKHQVRKIVLSPDNIDCIVFWTKNPEPFIHIIPELSNYDFYFHFTLNNYPKEIESGIPALKDRISTFRNISSIIGSHRIIWRYDPILFTEDFDCKKHIESFKYIASNLSGYTEQCITSILTEYRHTKRNMLPYSLPGKNDAETFIHRLNDITDKYKIKLSTCCTPFKGIETAACIDKNLIEKITGNKLNLHKDRNQRENCNCAGSVDIGSYDTCTNGCLYCYGTTSHQRAIMNRVNHIPENDFIEGNVSDDEIIKPHKLNRSDSQLKLF